MGAGDGSGAVGNLTRAAKRLYRVADQATQRADQVAHIRAVSVRLTAQVHDLQRTLEALKIYGMNVKIAAGGARDFVDFADLMAQKLDMGKADAAGFDGRLAELERGLASMLQSDSRLVSECARVVPQVPDRLIRDAGALATHQDGLAAMARTTGEIAASIQAKVATVLGAIQIGDIARQRLEHVLAGCEMLDAHLEGRAPTTAAEEAACHHLLALLHAQLEETAVDFRRETLVLVDSLRDLEPEANRLLALQAPQAGPAENMAAAGEPSFLRELESGIAEATAMIAQLQEADAQADQTLGLTIATVDDLTTRAAAIRHLRVDVQLMAINIGLSCRRVEAIGKPMTVIANEIRSHAETLDGAVTHITAAASDLEQCSAAMRGGNRAGEIGTGDELAQSLAMIRQGAQRTEQAIAVAGQQSDTIATMLRKTRDELEVSLDLAKTIEAIAVRTADLAGSGQGQEPAAHVLLHAGGQHGAQEVGISEVHLDQPGPGVERTRDVLGLRRLAGPVRDHPVDAVQLRQAGQPLVPVPRLRRRVVREGVDVGPLDGLRDEQASGAHRDGRPCICTPLWMKKLRRTLPEVMVWWRFRPRPSPQVLIAVSSWRRPLMATSYCPSSSPPRSTLAIISVGLSPWALQKSARS